MLRDLVSAAPTTCSCFTFHDKGLTWPAARKSCQYYGGDLVSVETEQEWQTLEDQIQKRSNRFNSSWHIGLRINSSGNWTWVSGKPLIINRWQPWQPRDGAPYAVMVTNYSPVTKGFVNSVRGSIIAGFICEKPAGNLFCFLSYSLCTAASPLLRGGAAVHRLFELEILKLSILLYLSYSYF